MLLLGVLAFATLLRMVPRVLLPHAYASDTYYHLFCAEVIRQAGFRIPLCLPKVILAHRYSYPFGYHFLLALCSASMRRALERFTGAIFDGIGIVAVYIFTCWLAQENGWEGGEILSLWVAAFYATAPCLLRLGSGPRAYNGSPRVIGETLFLGTQLFGYHGFVTGNVLSLLASCICGALLILSSKFANQVLVAFTLLMSLLVHPAFLLILLGSYVLAVLLSGKLALRVLCGHIWHSVFYYRYLQDIFIKPELRTLRGYIYSCAANAWAFSYKRRFIAVIDWFLSEQHPLHLLLTVHPHILLAGLCWLRLPTDAAVNFLACWMVAGLVMFALTRCTLFLFLGEAERYLEYILAPSLILMCRYLQDSFSEGLTCLLLFQVFSACWYLGLFVRRNRSRDREFPAIEAAFAELNRLPAGNVLPIGSVHWHTLLKTSHPVVIHGANIEERLISRDQIEMLLCPPPYPCPDILAVLARYDVRYVVTDRISANHYFKNLCNSSAQFFSRAATVADHEHLIIYRLDDQRAA